MEYMIIEEKHLWTSDEKLKRLGYGEWVEEFDKIKFEYRGYKAQINRIMILEPYAKDEHYYGGHLCGYVLIPNDDKYFAMEDIDIDCHGGVTFDGFNEDIRCIGFDCAHSGDYVPSTELFKKLRKKAGELDIFPIPEELKKYSIFNPTYKNIQFCIEECMRMIDQLHDLKVKSEYD